MKLSILTPTLDCAKTINDTLNSIIKLKKISSLQIEHLIGDGGSSDDTTSIIEEYVYKNKDCHFYYLPKKNIPETLNFLIKNSKGDYVCVLNSDDFYDHKKFNLLLEKIKQKTEVDIFCGNMVILSKTGSLIGRRESRINKLKNYMSINHQTMISKMKNHIQVKFNENTPNNYDYVWTWEQFIRGYKFFYFSDDVAFMRMGGISEKKEFTAAKEIFLYKLKKGYFLNCLSNFFMFCLKYFLKKILPNRIIFMLSRIYRKIVNSGDYVL
tara:strand:+ start:1941 stop:2744 length:804 start_codon:yes stop_codon:yes gene_type:complete